MIHIKSSPSVTHTESGSRAEVRPSLVNRDPLAVASEPRLPLVQPTGESYTSPLVVNLLTAETLVARHKGRTSQSATSTVVRAGVIVVGHNFRLFPNSLGGSTPDLGELVTRLSYIVPHPAAAVNPTTRSRRTARGPNRPRP